MVTVIHTLRRKLSFANDTFRRVIIVLGLLLALPVVGLLLASRLQPELVAAAVAVPLILVLIANHLEWAVVGMVATAAFVRFTLPSGTHSRIVASLLLTAMLLVIWVSRMLLTGRIQLRPSPANKPLIAFMVITLISYVWSITFRDPLIIVWDTWGVVQLGALAVMVLLPVAFLLGSNWLADERLLKWTLGLMVFAGFLAVLNVYTPLPLGWVQSRPLFPLWFVSLAFAQVLYNRHMSRWLRFVLLVLVSLWVLYTLRVWLGWFSAWLPTFLAMGVMALKRSRALFALLIVLAVIFVVLNWTDLTMVYEEQRVGSGETRVAAWVQSWQVLRGHFIFGVGPAGYAAYYMFYFPTDAMATHNNYLDILLQTGFVGLAAFLAFVGSLIRIAADLLKRTRRRADFIEAFSVGSAGGLLGTIVAMALGDWVIPFVYTQTIEGYDYAVYTWLLLGAMVSLHRLVVAGLPAPRTEAQEAA